MLPDSALIAVARDDDYMFGVLHSRIHELWARRMGTQLREAESGFRYTPETTFETFPFPWPPGKELHDNAYFIAISEAARKLGQTRDAWLLPAGTPVEELNNRTLTDLYNESPSWLEALHRDLDEAVFAAYSWPNTLAEQEILTRLLQLNGQRLANQQLATNAGE